MTRSLALCTSALESVHLGTPYISLVMDQIENARLMETGCVCFGDYKELYMHITVFGCNILCNGLGI